MKDEVFKVTFVPLRKSAFTHKQLDWDTRPNIAKDPFNIVTYAADLAKQHNCSVSIRIHNAILAIVSTDGKPEFIRPDGAFYLEYHKLLKAKSEGR